MNVTGIVPNMAVGPRDPFLNHKRNAIHAAEDLGYGRDVIKEVEAAKSSDEINRIMKSARYRRFGD